MIGHVLRFLSVIGLMVGFVAVLAYFPLETFLGILGVLTLGPVLWGIWEFTA